MEGRSLGFKCRLNRSSRGFGEEGWKAPSHGVNCFYFKATVKKIVGKLAADKARPNDSDFLGPVSDEFVAKNSIVIEIINSHDFACRIAPHRRTNELCAQREHELGVGYPLPRLEKHTLFGGFYACHAGPATEGNPELFGHCLGSLGGQLVR